MKQPKNETETHFMLKEIAKYILFWWGYTKVATEVHNMYAFDLRNSTKNMKSIIDAVGIKKCSKHIPRVGYQYWYDVRGIEAKASLSDFKNGFCSAPAVTYIIAPENIIPIDLLPERIGLIEVNFDELELKKYTNKVDEIKGIKVVKKAKRVLDSRFQNKEQYRNWCASLLDTVAYRSTQELLFWRNVIEFSK